MAAVREHDDRAEVVGRLHGFLQRFGQIRRCQGVILGIRGRLDAERGIFHYMGFFQGIRAMAFEQFPDIRRAGNDVLGGDFHVLGLHGARTVFQDGDLGLFLRL